MKRCRARIALAAAAALVAAWATGVASGGARAGEEAVDRPLDRGAAADAEDFRFELVVAPSPGEPAETLSIEGSRVSYVRPRAASAGEAVGLFRAAIDPDERRRLEAAVPGRPLPAPRLPGGLAVAVTLRTPRREADLRFVLPGAAAEVAPLLEVVHALERRVLAAPELAIRLELVPPEERPVSGEPARFRVAVVNAGHRAVTLALGASALVLETGEERARVGTFAHPITGAALAPAESHPVEIAARFPACGRRPVWARLEGVVTIEAAGGERLELLMRALTPVVEVDVAAP